MERIKKLFADRYLLAVIALAFILTAVKRWGVGGSVDPVWYSAVTGNIAKTGDFFQFVVTKNEPSIWDHMPLTYWIIGGIMYLTKVGDFYAKLYPIFCSFFTYIFTYLIGKELKDKFYGLMSVLALALTIHFLKWSSQVKMEVPLTFFFVATSFFMLKALINKDLRFFYPTAFFFALGILTKGPIIFAIPLALVIWMLAKREFWILASKHFYLSIAFLGLLLSILLLPPLHFNGENYYSVFYNFKKSYLAPSEAPGVSSYFFYIKGLIKGATIPLALFLLSLFTFTKGRFKQVMGDRGGHYWLLAMVIPCLILPLSIFKIKFHHYMIPAYPFLAVCAAFALYIYLNKFQETIVKIIPRFVIAVMVILLVLPIEVTGGREKRHINMINILKFDPEIKNKVVAYLGTYKDDMKVASEYSFYGDIDITRVDREKVKAMSLKSSYLILEQRQLPVEMADGTYSLKDCLFVNPADICVLGDRHAIQFILPPKKLPHEIFISR